MKKTLPFLVLVLVVFGVWFFLRRSAHPSVPRDISISYLGQTNDYLPGSSEIGLQAMFQLTNSSDQTVIYNVETLDFKTASGWKPTEPGARGRFGSWIEPSRSSVIWQIPVPNTRESWRLTLSCSECTKTPEGKLQGNGRHYIIVSPEVTP